MTCVRIYYVLKWLCFNQHMDGAKIKHTHTHISHAIRFLSLSRTHSKNITKWNDKWNKFETLRHSHQASRLWFGYFAILLLSLASRYCTRLDVDVPKYVHFDSSICWCDGRWGRTKTRKTERGRRRGGTGRVLAKWQAYIPLAPMNFIYLCFVSSSSTSLSSLPVITFVVFASF